MNVHVPATPQGLHHRVLPAILRSGHTARVWPMLSEESYFELMALLWANGRDFAIVEHDVEVDPDSLDSLDTCPAPWCAFSYPVFAGDIAEAYGGPFGLGCVRFRRELLEELPQAVQLAGEMNLHPVHRPRSYAVMDSTLTRVLRAHGVQVHQHFPNVTHHHAYLREGAFVAPASSGE